jgi:hypothetical protein
VTCDPPNSSRVRSYQHHRRPPSPFSVPMGKRRAPTDQPTPAARKPRKSSALGTIPWAANKSTLILQLLCEVEKTENFKVLFGKKDKREARKYIYSDAVFFTHFIQNTSGESKISVYKRIGSVLLPEMFALEPSTVADRVKAKMERYS